VIDFHNHLIPAVDDGAADLEQAGAALSALFEQGVRVVVTTPHVAASLTARPAALAARLAEIDAGWERLRVFTAREHPGLRLERGAEVMLDTPAPELGDPRTRLAGTRSVLVEFPHMRVPPNADQALFHVSRAGWTPVIAHPERYMNLHPELRDAREWRRMGAHLQVNAGSLLGRYGAQPQARAWSLLRLGWAGYLASDFHARGRLALADARDLLVARGGQEQASLLLEGNAARLLAGEPPLEVPPLAAPPPLWKRVLGFDR
jgi:protein-tyrosine phosphatase